MRDNLHLAVLGDAWNLLAHTGDESLDKPDMPIDDTRLHIVGSIFAKGRTWRGEIDAIQARGSAAQCLGGDHQPGGNGPTEEVTLRRDYIKSGGGAEGG